MLLNCPPGIRICNQLTKSQQKEDWASGRTCSSVHLRPPPPLAFFLASLASCLALALASAFSLALAFLVSASFFFLSSNDLAFSSAVLGFGPGFLRSVEGVDPGVPTTLAPPLPPPRLPLPPPLDPLPLPEGVLAGVAAVGVVLPELDALELEALEEVAGVEVILVRVSPDGSLIP